MAIELSSLHRAVRGRPAVLDGEIVSFDEQGRPSFRRLQKRMHVADAAAAWRLSRSDPAVLLMFDLLYLDGESLLSQLYTRRRARLEELRLADTAWQTPAAFAGRRAEAVAVI